MTSMNYTVEIPPAIPSGVKAKFLKHSLSCSQHRDAHKSRMLQDLT